MKFNIFEYKYAEFFCIKGIYIIIKVKSIIIYGGCTVHKINQNLLLNFDRYILYNDAQNM